MGVIGTATLNLTLIWICTILSKLAFAYSTTNRPASRVLELQKTGSTQFRTLMKNGVIGFKESNYLLNMNSETAFYRPSSFRLLEDTSDFRDFNRNGDKLNKRRQLAGTDPYNVTSIEGAAFHAGQNFTYAFSDKVFVDPDGNSSDLTYSISTTPDASAWMSFDPITRTLSGTPSFADAGLYTVQVIAEDLDPISSNGTTSFTLTFDAGLDIANLNFIVHQPFSYTVPSGGFGAAEGLMTSVEASVVPSNFVVVYNFPTRTVSGLVNQNVKAGSYTVKLTAKNSSGTVLNTVDVPIVYHKNLPPVIVQSPPPSPGCIKAFESYSYLIPKSSIFEPEDDEMLLWSSINAGEVKTYWFYIVHTPSYYKMYGVPTNDQTGNFKVKLHFTNEIDTSLKVVYEFDLCVEHNPDYIVVSQTDIQNGTVGVYWDFVFAKSSISLPAVPSPLFDPIASPNVGWISCSQNSTHIKCMGTPDNNDFSPGRYNIIVVVKEDALSTNAYAYEHQFRVKQNIELILGTPQNKTVTVPEGVSWNYGATWIRDPENLNYTRKIEVNGSTTIPNWLVYNLTDYTFSVSSPTNSIAGSYDIKVTVQDEYHGSQDVAFKLTIKKNLSPVQLRQIGEFITVRDWAFNFQLEPVSSYFEDPEGTTMTSYITQVSGDPLPVFFTYNSITNQFSGFVSDQISMHTWSFVYYARDSHGFESSTYFDIVISDCHYS